MTAEAESTGKNASPATPTWRLLAWALYDWANNAYAAIVLTFVFAAYFTRRVAENETSGTVIWGLLLGGTGILVALGAPVLGAAADRIGHRKLWLGLFVSACILATGMLWFVQPTTNDLWLAILLVAVSELGSEYASVLYNAMLPNLVPRHRLGRWSGWGWTLGYAGGLICLAIVLFLFMRNNVPGLDLQEEAAEPVRATFPFAAAWYLLFALPLFLFVPEVSREKKRLSSALREGVRQLVETARQVRRYAHIAKFLIARLIYIDGLATLFMFGGVYAAGTFNMDEQQVLMFGIGLNVSAGLGALAFSWIDDRIGGRNTILISLVGLIVPGTVLLFVNSVTMLWTFGLILGLFVGPVQAASRSFMAREAPEELRNQMFGLFALSGKVGFFCPLLVGLVTWLSGNQRVGVSVIIIFFAVGFAVMLTVPSESAE